MKKPALSILVKAFVVNADGGDDDGVCFSLLGPHEMPSFVASNQFFQTLVCRDEIPPASIEVTLLNYSVDPSCVLQVGLVSTGASVKVEHTRARQHHPKVKLPFGLTMPKRTRKPRQPGKPAKARARSAKEIHQSWQMSGHDAVPSSCSADSDSSASSSTSSSSSSDSNPDPEKESEEVHAPTEAAAREGAAVDDLNVEIVAERDLREAVASDYRSGRPIASTYFAQQVGLTDAVVTPRARGKVAKCYLCDEKILEGTVRFVWYFSPVRPSRWLHADCVAPCVLKHTDAAVKARAFHNVSELVLKNEAPTPVVAAAAAIKVLLVGSSSSSSSSHI
jgi:hypothetical protein